MVNFKIINKNTNKIITINYPPVVQNLISNHGDNYKDWLIVPENLYNKDIKVVNGIVVEDTDKKIKESNKKELEELLSYLKDTDYIIVRQLEQNTLTEEEYNVIKIKRQEARDKINKLQKLLEI